MRFAPVRRFVFAAALASLVVVAAPAGATAAARTIVSLTFDDASRDQFAVRTILARRGVPATFYVNSGLVGDAYHMTWDELGALAGDGNEIGGHGLTHMNLLTAPPEQRQHEICADRRNLVAHGFSVATFAYPYGRADASVAAVVRGCGYAAARGVALGRGRTCGRCPHGEMIPAGDAFYIRSAAAPTTLSGLQARVRLVERSGGGWLPIAIHNVCSPATCPASSLSVETLAAFLDWLAPRAARGTVVKTVREVVAASPAVAITRVSAGAAAAGASFSVAVRVVEGRRALRRGTAVCAAWVGGRIVTGVRRRLIPGIVRCTWRLPARSRGLRVEGWVGVRSREAFVWRTFTGRVA